MSFDANALLLSFIPLFVAIDVLGVVPLFLSLTARLDRQHKRRLVTDATLAALGVSLAFLFFGRFLFTVMGITEDDFRVGGGIILLVIAIVDLIFSPVQQRSPETTIGIVPIGIPLIIGPAALTTILILVDAYGMAVTIVSLLANLAIVWLVFRYSDVVVRVVGQGGSKAIAKVASLFMVAIAVMMIRVGLTNMLQ